MLLQHTLPPLIIIYRLPTQGDTKIESRPRTHSQRQLEAVLSNFWLEKPWPHVPSLPTVFTPLCEVQRMCIYIPTYVHRCPAPMPRPQHSYVMHVPMQPCSLLSLLYRAMNTYSTTPRKILQFIAILHERTKSHSTGPLLCGGLYTAPPL